MIKVKSKKSLNLIFILWPVEDQNHRSSSYHSLSLFSVEMQDMMPSCLAQIQLYLQSTY